MSGGGAKLLLPLLLINSAFADATTDARIQAYKANKLIPQNIVLPTSTGAADSDEVVVFSSSTLSWNRDSAGNAALDGLRAKYGDMTIDELRTAMGAPGEFDAGEWRWVEDGWLTNITTEIQELREYLSAVANGKLTSAEISAEVALAELNNQFETIARYNDQAGEALFGAFPCEGVDFTNNSNVTGDLTQCTGITAAQLMTSNSFTWAKLPAITFNGTENFSGRDVTGVNFTNCTGITPLQIATVSSIAYAKITKEQYDAWKSVLQTNFSGSNIYVDGVSTTIE